MSWFEKGVEIWLAANHAAIEREHRWALSIGTRASGIQSANRWSTRIVDRGECEDVLFKWMAREYDCEKGTHV